MIDRVGIKNSVRGTSRTMISRRTDRPTLRRIGPITKPMNRSMPVHSTPAMTWTKSRNQRLSPRIAAIITAKAATAAARYQGRSGEAAADTELDQLTAREREVLQLIARGYRYKEIAARLHLSARTVESHVSAVLRKLQLSSRHELTRWAAERRLI